MADLAREEILGLVKFASDIKAEPKKFAAAAKDRTLLMVFEKPSLRTRLSFEVGMTQMGGHAIFYSIKDSPLGKKETIQDTAKTASRYVDIVMIRANRQSDIREFAANSSVPVIDALSDYAHPCQILADLQTMQEKGRNVEKMKLAYMGNGRNNVTYDLMRACAILGATCYVGCPEGEEFDVERRVLDECNALAAKSGAKVVVTHDPAEAARGADVVYTDTWVNYDIPLDQLEARAKKLGPYQVNAALMGNAKPDAIFMNCLPAMRGKEQTADVIDGPQSVVFDEAENRLHAQKAIMLSLLGM
jgi:ornithine carbamoyltransferase